MFQGNHGRSEPEARAARRYDRTVHGRPYGMPVLVWIKNARSPNVPQRGGIHPRSAGAWDSEADATQRSILKPMKSTHIHIVLGESAGGTLVHRLGYSPRAMLVQHDPLSVGPLPRLRSLDEWRRVRAAFWNGLYCGSRGPEYPRDLLLCADKLRKCDAITVWVGGGASDQLLLPWVAHLFTLLDAPVCSMSIVQIDRLSPKGPDVVSLGEVSGENLRTHAHPAPVSPDDIVELKAYWSALTAPLPDELLQSIRQDTTAFPLLRRALRTILDAYPDVRAGLSHWDLELLKHVRSHGPNVASVIFHIISASNRAGYPDSLGDLYGFSRLRLMADRRLAAPALVMEGDGSTFGGTDVRLTAAGEAFVEGRKNFVELNGIDEWVAGVHLDSKTGDVWFRDGETLVNRR
jgi:hypothetical protein